MPLLFDELFTCPNCETIFQSKVLGSYNTFGNHYSDFYIGSEENPQPILYQLSICPKCGFAAYPMDYRTFSIELKNVQKALIETSNFVNKKGSEFNAGDGFILLIEYSTYLNLEDKIFLMLQATYAYRELKDNNLIKTRLKIISMLEQLIEKNQYERQTKEFYLYLLGELYRLVENIEKSLLYFKQALEISNKKSLISKLVEHQLKNPSDILPKGFLH
ncbi:MAG: DUF2225 domain-containing protein [Asgard group archaeon]|nr:DUF2225 domain-containing protein [Asgard group archaeon]